MRLEATAIRLGYQPSVWVVSAGLGMRAIDDTAPAYAATFSLSHPDSVGPSAESGRKWWASLTANRLSARLLAGLKGPSLWILSDNYARVVSPTLLPLCAQEQVLVVGGSDEVPSHVRLRSDAALQATLGGTSTSLNLRMAIAWLEGLHGEELSSAAALERWQAWATGTRRARAASGRAVTDAAVRSYVTSLLASESSLSKTRALTMLRSAGLACEQQRFGMLFHEVRGRS